MGSERPRPVAVTFDFWNTLFQPGQNLPGRLRQAAAFLRERGAQLPDNAIEEHFRSAQKTSDERWRGGEHFGGAGVARQLVQSVLGSGRDADAQLLLGRFQEPADDSEPLRPVPGVRAVLARLTDAGCRLGIVSDTGFLTGDSLRRILEREGLAGFFEPLGLAFSDEVGVPKPNPAIFQKALAGLGVDPPAAAHVGDLRFTDVAGARRLGMLSVRFAGWLDDQDNLPDADLVVTSYEELPSALGF